jgi:23S rRNA pseudouridine1911/1915/1917 synthase
LIKEERVWVNDKVITKPSFSLSAYDQIVFEVPDQIMPDIKPENIPLDILYEDDDLMVINKPNGMVVHPAPGHYEGTLVNAIMYHCKDDLSGINGEIRPGIVHRIDKDTTGSLVICKNDKAHIFLADKMKDHDIDRIYLGIVKGNHILDSGTVDEPIGRDPKNRIKMAVNRKYGKPAKTHYVKLAEHDGYALMAFRLETGRTHQIRVHMAHLGHPLLGDEVYGAKQSKFKLQGQCLHAYKLGFIHPTSKEYMAFYAPIPEYFAHLTDVLHLEYDLSNLESLI